MKLIISQNFFFQGDIFMKRFQIGMYGPDQIIVKADRNIIFCQAGFPGIFVSAYSGVKETAAAGSRQGCGQGVPVTVVRVHQAGK